MLGVCAGKAWRGGSSTRTAVTADDSRAVSPPLPESVSDVPTCVTLLAVQRLNPLPDLGELTPECILMGAKPPPPTTEARAGVALSPVLGGRMTGPITRGLATPLPGDPGTLGFKDGRAGWHPAQTGCGAWVRPATARDIGQQPPGLSPSFPDPVTPALPSTL